MKTMVANNLAEQVVLHANPVQEYRKPTDRAFIVLFAIIFLTWIGVTIQALSCPLATDNKSEKNVTAEDRYFSFDIERIELRFSWKFLLCTFLSGMVAIVYIFLLLQPVIDHIIIYLALVLVFALIILFFGLALFTMGFIFFIYWQFGYVILVNFSYLVVLYLAYQVLVFYCFAEIKMDSVFEIIQEACRSILFYPMSMLFVFSMSVLLVTIFSLSIFALGRISSHYAQYPQTMTYCVIEILSAVVVITFVLNFTQTVLSGFVIDWFWTEDQNSVSREFMWKHIDRTWRYHMGTVCFGSIPLLPNIWAIVQACVDFSDNSRVATEDNIFIRFIGQISLIINARDFAVIQTSMYGTDYVTSIKAAIDLVTQNPKMHLAAAELTNTLVLMGVFVTTMPFKIDELYLAMYSVPVAVFIILKTAFRALMVNRMIMDNSTDGVERLTYNLHDSPTAPMYSE